jgi:hypothetical protein
MTEEEFESNVVNESSRVLQRRSHPGYREIAVPVDRRDVHGNVDHITAQFVSRHVDRTGIGRDVDLRRDIEEKSLLDIRSLGGFAIGKSNLTAMKISSNFSKADNCRINFCTTLLNASKTE